ncbi:hypothetical protein HYU92_05320 [Candidatus Curtissbacteria bacterium]|nr:hypothetical protein [Candidatus Curtissbacteria bacterium]
MIRIAIPVNQPSVVKHLEYAGYDVLRSRGLTRRPDNPEGSELNEGIIGPGNHYAGYLRSMDLLFNVSSGNFDFGFVGSDIVEEKPYWPVETLDQYPYGRELGERQPRLEIVAHRESPARSVRDFKPGDIFYTERMEITIDYLQRLGLKVLVEGKESPQDFKRRVLEGDAVGVHEILGTSPIQIAPEDEFGVMVNESGDTGYDYELIIIAKIMDIKTLLIANLDSLRDETIREVMFQFQGNLREAFLTRKEFEMPPTPAHLEREL